MAAQAQEDSLAAILASQEDLEPVENAVAEDEAAIAARHEEEDALAAQMRYGKASDEMCVECTDQPADVKCLTCEDRLCDICFAFLHRRGTRQAHLTQKLEKVAAPVSAVQKDIDLRPLMAPGAAAAPPSSAAAAAAAGAGGGGGGGGDGEDQAPINNEPAPGENKEQHDKMKQKIRGIYHETGDGQWYLARAKYVPLRLSLQERYYLRLCEACMNVSEYTDKIDIYHGGNKRRRIVKQIKKTCAILCGLAMAHDYNIGQRMIVDQDFKDNADYFADVFELLRRHKVSNPEKHRETYGKLVYLLMDSAQEEIQDLLEFSPVRPMRTVYSMLEERDGLALLADPAVRVACAQIVTKGKSRRQIEVAKKERDKHFYYLVKKYQTDKLPGDLIKTALNSIFDNHCFLLDQRVPVDDMIELLETHFDPNGPTREGGPLSDLSIRFGQGGARLTHSHATQYQYVLQSLTLWRKILHNAFQLYVLAEQDMMDGSNRYRLRDTGQGLNRIQYCPRVAKAMSVIVGECMRELGSWVGSSVVHLGDAAVPNALIFLDKYTQIVQILAPVIRVHREIPRLAEDPHLERFFVEKFGGVRRCQMVILSDFFKHGFDGSGGEDFFNAGSCIDGRLTSAWDWCSRLDKKNYASVFKMAGFKSFNEAK